LIGIIQESTAKGLHLLHELRNDLAHGVDLLGDDSEVSRRIPDLPYDTKIHKGQTTKILMEKSLDKQHVASKREMPLAPLNNRAFSKLSLCHRFLLSGVSLALCCFLLQACSEKNSPSAERVHRKVLLFGIDGATWKVIDPLLKKGDLPHLASLIEQGTRSPLKTMKPTYSPRIWNTIATGVSPEVHGIESFVVKLPNGETSLPSSNMRKVKAIWNILSEHRYKVGVVGWWASFPAETVKGFIISDHANYVRKGIYKNIFGLTSTGMVEKETKEIYPPDLYDKIAQHVRMPDGADLGGLRRFVDLPPEKWRELKAQRTFSRSSHLSVLKFGFLNDEYFFASGMYALKKYSPDFMAFYFNGIDGVEHHFWEFMQPGKFRVSPSLEEIQAYRDVIPSYYRYMDDVLGRVLSNYSMKETTVIVLSDHGHHANSVYGTPAAMGYGRVASGTHDDAPDGILILSGKDIVRGARLKGPSVYDITPTILALMGLPPGRDMPGKVLENAINREFLIAHTAPRVPTYSSGWKSSSVPARSKKTKLLKQKLKALGYMN